MIKWKTIDRKRVKHIRSSQRMLAAQFARIRKQLSDAMSGYTDPTSLQVVVDNFQVDQDVLFEAYRNIYTETGLEFAKFNYKQIKGQSSRYEKKDYNDDYRESIWIRKLLEYVQTDCGTLIQQSTRNMYSGIQRNAQKAIAMAANEGWGADRTANEIIKLQGQMDKFRAMRIARTEVMRASNEGAMIGANELDIELKKVWISTEDGRTRTFADGDFDHSIMNGVTVEMNEPFNVSGENMDYPGDPNGSEGNTINCRCAVAFEPKEPLL
jgi:hypothetical protein